MYAIRSYYVDAMFKRHAETMVTDSVNGDDLQTANSVLQRLERFWGSPNAYAGMM